MNHFIGSPCFKLFVSLRMLHALSVLAAFLVLWQRTPETVSLGKGKAYWGTQLRVLVTGSWPIVWGLWWDNRWWQRQEVDKGACLLPEKQRKEVLGLVFFVWDTSNDLRPLASSYLSKELLDWAFIAGHFQIETIVLGLSFELDIGFFLLVVVVVVVLLLLVVVLLLLNYKKSVLCTFLKILCGFLFMHPNPLISPSPGVCPLLLQPDPPPK